MYFRKVENIFNPSLYRNDFDIINDIEDKVNFKITDKSVLSSNVQDMRNGETIIDKANNRKVISIDGSLYKEIVDSNNNVILTKIEG